jgi:hypothetical protein
MNSRRPNARTALILLTTAVFAVTAVSMRSLGRYQPFADLTGEGAQSGMGRIGLSMTDAIVQGRAAGRLRWRATARTVAFSRDRREATAEGIANGILFDADEKPVVRLSAGRALYEEAYEGFTTGMGETLRVDGGIHAELLRRPGMTLETQSLSWDGVTNTLRTEGRVVATLPNGSGRATADRIQADTRSGDFALTHVHGTFRVPPEIP